MQNCSKLGDLVCVKVGLHGNRGSGFADAELLKGFWWISLSCWLPVDVSYSSPDAGQIDPTNYGVWSPKSVKPTLILKSVQCTIEYRFWRLALLIRLTRTAGCSLNAVLYFSWFFFQPDEKVKKRKASFTSLSQQIGKGSSDTLVWDIPATTKRTCYWQWIVCRHSHARVSFQCLSRAELKFQGRSHDDCESCPS